VEDSINFHSETGARGEVMLARIRFGGMPSPPKGPGWTDATPQSLVRSDEPAFGRVRRQAVAA